MRQNVKGSYPEHKETHPISTNKTSDKRLTVGVHPWNEQMPVGDYYQSLWALYVHEAIHAMRSS